jgi:hypothetical protein
MRTRPVQLPRVADTPVVSRSADSARETGRNRRATSGLHARQQVRAPGRSEHGLPSAQRAGALIRWRRVRLATKGVAVSSEDAPSKVDTSVAHPARRYDYWLGGKDNFAVDRESGDAVEEQFPTIRLGVRENRWFMCRAVDFAAVQGIRQFLDIGTGIPTTPNTHQIAQEAEPAARIVYVDNDPLVLVHARALMSGTPQGATTYLQADLREHRKILEHQDLRTTVDLSKPVALMLLAVLHFIRDDEDPRAIVDTLIDALPEGSLVIASHATLEHSARRSTLGGCP